MFFRRKPIWNRHIYRRSKLSIILGLGFFIILGLTFFISLSNSHEALPVSTKESVPEPGPLMLEIGKLLKLLDIQEEKMRQILGEACPVVDQHIASNIKAKNNFWNLLSSGITLVTDIENGDPKEYLQTQMAALAIINSEETLAVGQIAHSYENGGEEDFYLETPEGLDDWHFEFKKEPVELSKDPVILLYTTHNAETYRPTDGKSKLEGKNAGVAKVAQAFAETLENKYGLKTIRSETIHDFPDWTRSYIKSLQTAQKLLKVNKTIQAVFDIHRDAGFKSKETTTTEINGRKAAKLMIVIGTEHKRWRENLAFAEKLEKKANELYPGLVRDIRIRNNRRYNQHLHPHALILEVGSDLNTLGEAQYSIALFARVTAEIIRDTSQ